MAELQYTPWMAQAGQVLGGAMAERGIRRQQEEQNKLAGSAYMGDPQAMQELMQLNPQMGAQIMEAAARKKKETEQESLQVETRAHDMNKEVQTEVTRVLTAGAKLPYEQARTYVEAELKRLGPMYPKLQEAMAGGDGIYDQEEHQQYIKMFGEKEVSEGAADPSNVREYNFFKNLPPDKKEEYLTMRRANSLYKAGDVSMVASQLTPTGTALGEGAPTTQAEQQKKLTEQQSIKEASKEAAVAAVDLSKEAFTKIAPIRLNLGNYDEAIRLVDEGADTGVISSRFPSMKQASIELDNLQGRLGLDVVGNTTFGALSESELNFALDTAMPKKLEGPELQSWLKRKKASQEKLLAYTERAATYLGTPGNTVAGWIVSQKQDGEAKSDRRDELRKKAGF